MDTRLEKAVQRHALCAAVLVTAACDHGAVLTSDAVPSNDAGQAGDSARDAGLPLTDAETACIRAKECCIENPNDDNPDALAAGCSAGLAIADSTLCGLAVSDQSPCNGGGTLSSQCNQLCFVDTVPSQAPSGPPACVTLFSCCDGVIGLGGAAACRIIASGSDHCKCLRAIEHLQIMGSCASVGRVDSGVCN